MGAICWYRTLLQDLSLEMIVAKDADLIYRASLLDPSLDTTVARAIGTQGFRDAVAYCEEDLHYGPGARCITCSQ